MTSRKIFYTLNESTGDSWYFKMGLVGPDGASSHVFVGSGNTGFRPETKTSYASPTPEEAIVATEERLKDYVERAKAAVTRAQEELGIAKKNIKEFRESKALLAEEGPRLVSCREKVEKFFGGDMEKTRLWFKTPNPLLGDVSPDDMISLHKTAKLLAFIEEALS